MTRCSLIIVLSIIAACSSGPSSSMSPEVNSSTSSAVPTKDAGGHWALSGTECNFRVLPTIDISPTQTVDGIQSFHAESVLDTADVMTVAYSEGTLDIQTGDMILCYTDSLSSCAVRCSGTLTTEGKALLTCNNIPSGVCQMTLQK